MSDPSTTADAWRQAANPITLAYLAPSVAAQTPAAAGERPLPMEELLAGPLKRALPGSARHHALVEAMRRLYRSRAMAAHRADKERATRRPH
jgi:hypothetical protein